MVVFLGDGIRYARNMYMLMKYTKNKLCIKLVFLFTLISRFTVNKTYKFRQVYITFDNIYSLDFFCRPVSTIESAFR